MSPEADDALLLLQLDADKSYHLLLLACRIYRERLQALERTYGVGTEQAEHTRELLRTSTEQLMEYVASIRSAQTAL